MKLIIIAALNRRRVIGRNGKIPWHIPEDRQRFKELTTGHTVLMGRKTYESIGKPLSERRNVVLTSQNLSAVEHYHSLHKALTVLKNEEKVFVIGGAEIYKQTIEQAEELLLTVVENDEFGDTFFPHYESLLKRKFTLVEELQRNGYSFLRYIKSK